MANQNPNQGNQQNQGSRGGNRGNFALDNLTYDVITVLHEKSKGLEAFDKYIQDAQGNNEIREIFERMRQQDQELIRELEGHLGKLSANFSQQDKAA